MAAQFIGPINSSSHLLKCNIFANCHLAVLQSVFRRKRRRCPADRPPSRPSVYRLLTSGNHCSVGRGAGRGDRWNYRAKSFVEQLEGISSSVLLERVGQAEGRHGKSARYCCCCCRRRIWIHSTTRRRGSEEALTSIFPFSAAPLRDYF